MQPDQPQKKRLTVLAIVVGLILFGWLIFLIAKDAGKIKVYVGVFPSDASLTIDGKPAKPGYIHFTKGKHTLKATRKYFGDATKEIDTNTIDPSRPIYVATDPNTPAAAVFLAAHPDEQHLLERIRGIDFTTTQDILTKKYPTVISALPHDAIDYRIYYESDANRNITIYVILSPSNTPGSRGYDEEMAQYKSEALDWMKANNIDTTKIPIVYKDENGQKL